MKNWSNADFSHFVWCAIEERKFAGEKEKPEGFPFVINKFYNKEEIWRGLGVGARGGIRVNKGKNFVVVFSDVKSDRISMADYGRNVYADYYDSASGLYKYTGEGQQYVIDICSVMSRNQDYPI